MSNVLIAFLAAAGASAWMYTKFMRRTGGNTKSSLISVSLLAIVVFFVVWTLALSIDSYLE